MQHWIWSHRAIMFMDVGWTGGCCFYFCEARLPKEEVPADPVSQCRVRAVWLTLTEVLQMGLPILKDFE